MSTIKRLVAIVAIGGDRHWRDVLHVLCPSAASARGSGAGARSPARTISR